MQDNDWYSLLNIPRNASNADIKKAFRRLANKYHPDKSSEQGSPAKFIQIKAAYEVLINYKKRLEYDRQHFFSKLWRTPASDIHTAEELFLSFENLQQKFKQADIRFLDFDYTYQLILELIKVYSFKDITLSLKSQNKEQLLALILNCVNHTQLIHSLELCGMLSVYFNNAQEAEQIRKFIIQQKWKHIQEKYTVYIVLFLSIIICCTIILAGTK